MRQLVPATVAALLLVSCSNAENAKNIGQDGTGA